MTVDGVTVRYGRNSQPAGAADFSFTGRRPQLVRGGTGGTFTLSNAVVSDNTNVNGYGGGLNVDTVSSLTDRQRHERDLPAQPHPEHRLHGHRRRDQPLRRQARRSTSRTARSRTTQQAGPNTGGGAIYFRPTTDRDAEHQRLDLHLQHGGGPRRRDLRGDLRHRHDRQRAGTRSSPATAPRTPSAARVDLDSSVPHDDAVLTVPSEDHREQYRDLGGGVYVGNSNVTLSKSIIIQEQRTSGSGIQKSVDVATATVSNNWWGCSTGPGAAPCDTAATAGGDTHHGALVPRPADGDHLAVGRQPVDGADREPAHELRLLRRARGRPERAHRPVGHLGCEPRVSLEHADGDPVRRNGHGQLPRHLARDGSHLRQGGQRQHGADQRERRERDRQQGEHDRRHLERRVALERRFGHGRTGHGHLQRDRRVREHADRPDRQRHGERRDEQLHRNGGGGPVQHHVQHRRLQESMRPATRSMASSR